MPDLATQILGCEANIAADRYLIGLMARAADTPLLRRERLAAKAGLVLRQVELLSLLWDEADEKAGFRPDQPRHPRGSGPIGGRWSGGAGTIIVEPAGGKPGHHYVPQALIRRMSLTPEARRLLLEATTGELEEGQNLYDADHRKYNEAVERHVMQFLRENQDRLQTGDRRRGSADSAIYLEVEGPEHPALQQPSGVEQPACQALQSIRFRLESDPYYSSTGEMI